MARGGYNHQIWLSHKARQDLEWWSVNLPKWNRKQLQLPPHSLEIETDTSQRGWGACCDGILSGGCWSMAKALHINAQELLAALYGIKAFAQDHSNLHILPLTDNTTAVAHINRLGGTKSQVLVQIVKELWQWCLDWEITITARHLPGLENIQADFMSRHLRPLGLGSQSPPISLAQSAVGTVRHGPLCNKVVKTTTNVLQLETRSQVSI